MCISQCKMCTAYILPLYYMSTYTYIYTLGTLERAAASGAAQPAEDLARLPLCVRLRRLRMGGWVFLHPVHCSTKLSAAGRILQWGGEVRRGGRADFYVWFLVRMLVFRCLGCGLPPFVCWGEFSSNWRHLSYAGTSTGGSRSLLVVCGCAAVCYQLSFSCWLFFCSIWRPML